jgi:DNA-binding IclR family transcriptional regulator
MAASSPVLSATSQTLVRGLDVLELVAAGPLALSALASRLGLSRSTAHRLASALLERRYLTLVPKQGYGLGPKMLELGARAQEQTALVRVAQPVLDRLSAETKESACLCVAESGTALVLAWAPGRRRLLSRIRIGERWPLARQAAGLALLLDGPEEVWLEHFRREHGGAAAPARFLESQLRFAQLGYAFDPPDAQDSVRAVAAPVRGAQGDVLAAVGLSTAAQYLDDSRLGGLGASLCAAAAEIGSMLGGDLRATAGGKPAEALAPGTALATNGTPVKECLVCE